MRLWSNGGGAEMGVGGVVFVGGEDDLGTRAAEGLQDTVVIGRGAEGAQGGEAVREDGRGEIGVGGSVEGEDVPVEEGEGGRGHDGLEDDFVGGQGRGGFLPEDETSQLGQVSE